MRVFLLSVLCGLVMSVFSYVVLLPTVGFDDANIVMSYAQNIAVGHGYVYNIGGERVEGSTSPLWTTITTLAFLLPIPPEMLLAALGLVITIATLWVSMQIGHLYFRVVGLETSSAPLLIVVAFLSLPSFFGWTVWSLMDLGLWLFLVTATLWLTLRLIAGETDGLLSVNLAVIAALMSVTRPEGIAVAFAFAALLGIFGRVFDKGRYTGTVLATMLVTCLFFAIVGGLRYMYFGDIFPNTYYAKVSTNGTARIFQGMVYVKNFLQSPFSLGVIVLAVTAPLAVRLRGFAMQPFLRLWAVAMLVSAGGAGLYVYLGGDHFGSFRFFLFLFPALFPLAALTLVLVWRGLSSSQALPYAIAVTLVAATWSVFWVNKGDYEREFRIAEIGREIGRRMNEYPDQPSLGIIAAGGVAMTYEGHLYDLLGLNWVEMARADRQKVPKYVNHGGFSRDVFYANLPDIVLPRFAPCDQYAYDNSPFFPPILDYIFSEPEFQDLYTFECWREMAFYRRSVLPSAATRAELP